MRNPSSNPIERFLDRLSKRSALTCEEQAAIRGLSGHSRDYRAHCDIVSPGEDVGHACLVADGLIGRFDKMRDGERQITAFHVAGDMCDLHSIVSPGVSRSITAIGRATAFLIPNAQLKDVATRHPAIALAFWRDCTVDFSILAKWVGNLGRKQSISRIAHLICEMGVRLEYAGLASKSSFELAATQEQLADVAGITKVHMNRVLKALRGQGLLTIGGGRVGILDWDGLAALADFDPGYLMLEGPPERAAVGGPILQLVR